MDVCLAYTSWLFGGATGLHHLYLTKWARAILYGHTVGGFGILWLFDMCTLPGQIRRARQAAKAQGDDAGTREQASHFALARRVSWWRVLLALGSQVVLGSLYGGVLQSLLIYEDRMGARELPNGPHKAVVLAAVVLVSSFAALIGGRAWGVRLRFLPVLATAAVLTAIAGGFASGAGKDTANVAAGVDLDEDGDSSSTVTLTATIAAIAGLAGAALAAWPPRPSQSGPHGAGEATVAAGDEPAAAATVANALAADESASTGQSGMGGDDTAAGAASPAAAIASAPNASASASAEPRRLPLPAQKERQRQKPRRCRGLVACCSGCGALLVIGAFWTLALLGAVLQAPVSVDSAGRLDRFSVHTEKLGPLLWRNRATLLSEAAAAASWFRDRASRLGFASFADDVLSANFRRGGAHARDYAALGLDPAGVPVDSGPAGDGAAGGERGGGRRSRRSSRGSASDESGRADGSDGSTLRRPVAAADVRAAYHRMAKLHHPDRLPPGASDAEREAAAERFREIQAAKERLLKHLKSSSQ